MIRRKGIKIITGLVLGLGLTSCGGGSLGIATSSSNKLTSDVATGTDARTAEVCSKYSVKDDSASFTINTVAQSGKAVIVVDSATVTFKKKSSTAPDLPPQYAIINQTINAGSSASVSFTLISQSSKTAAPLVNLVCTNTIWDYYATIDFKAHELYSGNSINIDPAQMIVSFADFIDS